EGGRARQSASGKNGIAAWSVYFPGNPCDRHDTGCPKTYVGAQIKCVRLILTVSLLKRPAWPRKAKLHLSHSRPIQISEARRYMVHCGIYATVRQISTIEVLMSPIR